MTTAIAPTTHISPGSALRHGFTLAGRAVTKVRKNPESLLDVTLQPIIFLLLFVYLFGGAIQGSTDAYLQVLLPGLMVQNIAFASLGTGMALNTDITKGVFDRFRSMPIARSAPLIGAVLGDVVRFVVTLTVLFTVAVIMGFRVQTDPGRFLIAIALLIAFGLCLCWVSVFVGMLVKSPQAVPGTLVAFIFPLTFGSNVFVPSDSLPGWLQVWVDINPVTHLANAARGLLLGGDWVGDAGWAFLWGIGIAAVFFPLALRAYRKRVG
ncbi:ABC transporter permease [Actinokineospora globicatena]|uniref:Transport permease protein n=1 Tax=Actinokineospora globicatena TaxID=103729 RepID=A0A9W6V997_9PSEU|nr:ABC transporter permease [Actinokineospora globicatena]MCP2300902.1 oleandomycin transport system permease protein [Actinokineospora globicatena]GLW77472.1 transport permease protein [Actinokineospora globicatena]GLW84306.1 transport permease protein [Actinokineospora globicatena]GLW93107.1 transport permease protein [Actinokineospora globicatena]